MLFDCPAMVLPWMDPVAASTGTEHHNCLGLAQPTGGTGNSLLRRATHGLRIHADLLGSAASP